MRRIIMLIAALALVVGATTLVQPSNPAGAHPTNYASAVCNYIRQANGWGDYIGYYHTIHYGSYHVVQCTTFIVVPGPDLFGCFQYIVETGGGGVYQPSNINPPYCW
jgi:hypothetical protein